MTSIYGANTKEWYETHSRTDMHGHSETHREFHEAHTQLGLKLKPPMEPAGPTHPGLRYAIGGFAVFVGLSVLCPTALTIPAIFIPIIGVSSNVADITSIPNWETTSMAVGGGVLCIGLVVLLLLIWLGIRVKRRFDRDMQNYKEKKDAFERDEVTRWEHARERWEELYYCMRDDTVFIPAENKAIRADDMEKYLYDPLFRSDS